MKAHLRFGFLFGTIATSLFAALPARSDAPARRPMTFADRVAAQEAIERVYYAHTIGATEPFETAVPRASIERKVRTYLEQSLMLERFWKAPIGAEALRREAERIAGATQYPDRLRELYAALHDDPFLIQECLARQTLAGRLSRNFFANDQRIHEDARAAAERLRGRLTGGSAAPAANTPVRVEVESAQLGAEGFRSLVSRLPAKAGEFGAVQEEPDSFVVSRLVEISAGRVSFDRYAVPKTTWEQWLGSQPAVDVDEVQPVAGSVAVPFPAPAPAAPACRPDSWLPKSRDEDPSVRVQHTAVWTGREMIVWGGYGPDGVDQHTGGRYDPLTDTWAPTSQVNAPTAARGHTAVWTGSEMIVAIGTNFGTSGRYDPLTDTWKPVSTVGAPTAMRYATATWIGAQMFTPAALYNPATDTWTSINVDISWQGYVATWTGRYVLLLFGRFDAPGMTFYRYEPAANEWTTMSSPPIPGRESFSTAWTGSRLIVWGGVFGFTQQTRQALNSGGVYDPVQNSWTQTSATGAPSARFLHSAVWSGNRMIVWGGNAGPIVGSGPTLDTGGFYDPATDTWSPMTAVNPPLQRDSHTAVWTGSLMIVWGGLVGHSVPNETEQISNGARYDPAADTWTPAGTTPLPRTLHTAVWTGTQMIVWGGQTLLEFAGYQYANTGGRYDPILEDWSATTTLNAPGPRIHHVAVWTGSRMLVWSGFDGSMLGDGARYDPVADSWTAMAAGPAPRYSANAVWTGTEMIAWGGQISFGGPTGVRYNPITNSWSAKPMADGPGSSGGDVVLWIGTRMAVWGGGSVSLYDPSNNSWTVMSGINSPPAASGAVGVWTGTEIFIWPGGAGPGGGFMVARFNPTTNTWAYGTSTNAPQAGGPAVWSGSEMLLWGDDAPGNRYNPDLDRWSPMTTVGEPIRRHSHTSLWTGSVMLIWGGEHIFGYLGDSARYDPGQTDADFDGDGFTVCGGDCDDHNAAIHPGAVEICNGVDDNCDGVRDEGFPDADGDGWAACGGDCNDANPAVHPGAIEICNGIDDDCNGLVDDGFFDADGDGYAGCGGPDCDDTNAAIHPGAVEICNGVDDNCDGVVDENGPVLCQDNDPCTSDTCGGALGCRHAPSSGAFCTSPSFPAFCFPSAVCVSGVCQLGAPADADGDGHVDHNCGGDDCTDVDPQVWHVPVEVTHLTLSTSSPATLAWDSQAAAAGPGTAYGIAAGAFDTSGSGIDPSVCLGYSSTASFQDDQGDIPSLNQVFWYLVNAVNPCGSGGYGSGSDGVPRAIPACP